MAFWKKKKYCNFCGSELKADGSCSNEKCITYKKEDPSKTDTAKASDSKEG